MGNKEESRKIVRRSDSVMPRELMEKRSQRQRIISYFTVLSTEMLERMAFYSLSINLVLFLNIYPYRWESYNAASASFFFLGISYLTSVFSGWISDSFLGKFRTIIIGFIIYLATYAFLPLLSPRKDQSSFNICHFHNYSYRNITNFDSDSEPKEKYIFDENCSSIIFTLLFFMGVGVGTVKTNLTGFAGDQARVASNQSRRRFFNWFYWSTNVGVFLAIIPIAYLQQNYSFFEGYLVPCLGLALALIVFIMGCGCYVKRPATGSTLKRTFKVIFSSFRSRSNMPRGVTCLQGELEKPSFLDRAKIKYGGQYRENVVDDVKTLLKILCVFLGLIPYWLVYFQMETTFPIQGLHMVWSVNRSSPKIAVAWLTLWDVIMLLVLIPIMDRLVYPRLDAAGYHFSMINRITFGMCFTVASMLVAGGLETVRLKIFWPNATHPFHNASVFQTIKNDTYQAANISIFWQLPQYALLGISEVFTSVAGLEFAYSKAPKSMKSLIMGAFFFATGCGAMLGIAAMKVCRNIFFFDLDHGNINCRIPCKHNKSEVCFECHLDYYFYALAIFLTICLIIFVIGLKFLSFRDECEAPRRRVSRYNSFENNTVSREVSRDTIDPDAIG